MTRMLTWAALIAAAPFMLFFGARGGISLATERLEKRYPPPGRMVSVGTHRLHLYCMGTGSPTIVIEPGMGVDWVRWRPVTDALAVKNQVCVYDRGGYGWSEPGPMPRTALQLATELHSLLMNGSVPGRYLLVVHSFGGYIARMYASQFPDTLSGIVMIDTLQESPTHRPISRKFSISGLVPPIGWERLERLYRGAAALPPDLTAAPKPYEDRFLIASSLAELKSSRSEFDSLFLSDQELGTAQFPSDLPLTVITAGNDPAHWEAQKQLLRLSRRSKQVIADKSGHGVFRFQAETVVGVVEEMLTNSVEPSRVSLTQ